MNILQSVKSKNYVDFYNQIKDVFKDKMSNHIDMVDFKNKYQDIQNMKKAFSNITDTYGNDKGEE